jgi:hypothetical protein
MRTKVWLIAASAGFLLQPSGNAAAAGGPLETPPMSETVRERAANAADPQHEPLLPLEIVSVRVYKATRITAAALRAALAVAKETFAAASIQVVWKVCEPDECHTPPSPDERMVRLVRLQGGQARDLICLGDALIDSQSQTAVLATVYVDRVDDLARHLDVDHQTLLGRTIAHEIGHLLLASNTHSASGLMRQVWSGQELRGRRADDWVLLPFEAAAIRQRLTLVRPTT